MVFVVSFVSLLFKSLEIDVDSSLDTRVVKSEEFPEVNGQVSTEQQVSGSTEEPPEQAE